MQKLTKRVLAETGFQWANVGAAITDDGVILIDCPVRPTDSRKWQKDLRALSPLGIRYLISTDYHGDHSIGAAFVEGVTYIAPQLVYEQIAKVNEKLIPSRAKNFIGPLLEQGFKEEAEEVANAVVPLPKISFQESIILHFPPLTFEIRRLGGHSPACSVVYIPEENVLFSGDIVIEEPNPGMGDASIGPWIKALEWIEGVPVDRIVPGHGEVCGKDTVRRLKEQFIMIRSDMEKLVRAGRAKGEAVVSDSFDKLFWADTSRGAYWVEHRRDVFRKGLERVYDEVKGEIGRK